MGLGFEFEVGVEVRVKVRVGVGVGFRVEVRVRVRVGVGVRVRVRTCRRHVQSVTLVRLHLDVRQGHAVRSRPGVHGVQGGQPTVELLKKRGGDG
jgi:hypothetical protein